MIKNQIVTEILSSFQRLQTPNWWSGPRHISTSVVILQHLQNSVKCMFAVVCAPIPSNIPKRIKMNWLWESRSQPITLCNGVISGRSFFSPTKGLVSSFIFFVGWCRQPHSMHSQGNAALIKQTSQWQKWRQSESEDFQEFGTKNPREIKWMLRLGSFRKPHLASERHGKRRIKELSLDHCVR